MAPTHKHTSRVASDVIVAATGPSRAAQSCCVDGCCSRCARLLLPLLPLLDASGAEVLACLCDSHRSIKLSREGSSLYRRSVPVAATAADGDWAHRVAATTPTAAICRCSQNTWKSWDNTYRRVTVEWDVAQQVDMPHHKPACHINPRHCPAAYACGKQRHSLPVKRYTLVCALRQRACR
jgi:hypothetical protein